MKEGGRKRDVVIKITYREASDKLSFTTDYVGNWAPFALIMFEVILSVWEEAVPTKPRDPLDLFWSMLAKAVPAMSGMGAKTSAGPEGNDRMWRIGIELSDPGKTAYFIRISSKDLEERERFRRFFNKGTEEIRYIRISVSPKNTYQWSSLTPETYWEAKMAKIHERNEKRNSEHEKKFAEDEKKKGEK